MLPAFHMPYLDLNLKFGLLLETDHQQVCVYPFFFPSFSELRPQNSHAILDLECHVNKDLEFFSYRMYVYVSVLNFVIAHEYHIVWISFFNSSCFLDFSVNCSEI